MTRRHRISEDEIKPVFEALTDQLAVIAATHDADMVPYLKDMHLFRIWWRIKEEREGKPCYPVPLTYGTIRDHIGTVSQSIGITPPTGYPQPAASFDTAGTSDRLRAGGQPKEVEQ